MPVLAKFCGIVIRMLVDRTFGIHLHAIYGDAELVIGLKPVRVIQGDVPAWVRACALTWVRQHEGDFPMRLAPRRVILARLQNRSRVRATRSLVSQAAPSAS